MANRRNKPNIKDERIEDTTMYGEFISSFNQWMTPDRQMEKAKYMEEITKELAPNPGLKTKNNHK